MLVTACGIAAAGCDNYRLVETSRFQVADRNSQVVLSKAECDRLRELAQQPMPVGRYQMVHEGVRTWRFDTVTGRECLLLATDTDWKGKGGQQNSCFADDLEAARERHAFYPSLFDDAGNPLQQTLEPTAATRPTQ